MKNFLILLGCIFVLSSCSAKKHKPLEVVGLEKIQQRIVEASGIGLPGKSAVTGKEMRESSYKLAREMAERQIEAIIMGLQCTDGRFMNSVLASDAKLFALVRKLIQKSTVTRKEWTNDNGCAVTLRLTKSQIEKKLKLRLK